MTSAARAAFRPWVEAAGPTVLAAAVYAVAASAGDGLSGLAAANAGPAGPALWLAGRVLALAGAGVFAAAVLRIVLDPPSKAPSLRLGRDEVRMFIALALVALVLVFIALLGFMAVVMVTLAFLAASGADAGTDIKNADAMFAAIGPFGRAAVATTVLGTIGVVAYTCARLAGSPAATFKEKAVRIFSTWEHTAGRAFPVALAAALALAPGAAASAAIRLAAAAAPAVPDVVLTAAVGFADAVGLGVAALGLSAYVYGRAAPQAHAIAHGEGT